MRRIYHPYNVWEDWKAGLYNLTYEDEEGGVRKAKSLLQDLKLFAEVAMDVTFYWEKSSEVNLSNRGRNRRAWIGQASCCYKYGVPEYVTKMAWRLLLPSEQKDANKVADIIIEAWEIGRNAKKKIKQERIGSY